jgi:hypothetical protein
MGIVLVQKIYRPAQVEEPSLRKKNILVDKSYQIIYAPLDRVVVSLCRRGKPLLHNDLVARGCTETGRSLEIRLKYCCVIYGNDEGDSFYRVHLLEPILENLLELTYG